MKKRFMSLFLICVMMIVSASSVFAKKLPMMVTDERRAEIDKAIGSYAEAWIDDEDFGIKDGKTETGNKHEMIIPVLEFPDHQRVLDVREVKDFDTYMNQVLDMENPNYKVITGKATLDVIYDKDKQKYESIGGNSGGKEYVEAYKRVAKKFKSNKGLYAYHYAYAGMNTSLLVTDGKQWFARPFVWFAEDFTGAVAEKDIPIFTGDEWFAWVKSIWEDAVELTEEQWQSGDGPAGASVIRIAGADFQPIKQPYDYLYYVIPISVVAILLVGSFFFIKYQRKKE